MFVLYYGNPNYSSWSLRPWLLLRQFGIPFEGQRVDVAGRGANDLHRAYSANGLVPCLHVDGFQIWDTLAIAEYLAEQFPEMWPIAPLARARARSISAEMHSGFGNLRGAMSMNIKLRLQGKPPAAEVASDIARVAQIWADTRHEFAAPGSNFLFGEFTIADAMFAPVVWRFHTYNITLDGVAAEYQKAMLALPAMQEWEAMALADPVALPHYDSIADQFGGLR